MEALAEVYIKKYLHVKRSLRLALVCKLVPIQCREYEYSLFTGGGFPFSQIFGWKFRKLSLSNGKPFFFPVTPTLQFHWLINKSTWWRNDGARRQQNRNGTVISVTNVGTEKSGVQCACKDVHCLRKFPSDPRVPFALQPVKPKLSAKWKAPWGFLLFIRFFSLQKHIFKF